MGRIATNQAIDGDRYRTLAARVAAAFASVADVTAIALGGSVATGMAIAGSDIDVYVFVTHEPPLETRRRILAMFADRAEIGNTAFGAGDEWIDRDTGIAVDAMYWNCDWIEGQMRRVLMEHQASLGYSTAFCHTIQHAVPLHDNAAGWFADLQALASAPYPEALRRNIIALNLPLLELAFGSFQNQIGRALGRADVVSVQHRVTAWLASAFDILFALNRLPHPGEKRLLDHVARSCAMVPTGFDADVRRIITLSAAPAEGEELLALLHRLAAALSALSIEAPTAS